MCVLDVLSMRVKTGISHWRLRPAPAVIDPLVSLTLPREVTASAGMDIVCHALESYTARYYTTFDRKHPEQRITKPLAFVWSWPDIDPATLDPTTRVCRVTLRRRPPTTL